MSTTPDDPEDRMTNGGDACVCCGRAVEPHDRAEDGYCLTCSLNRCDTSAGMEAGCPSASPVQGSSRDTGEAWRKRPVVVYAVHFDGTGESCTAVTQFLGGTINTNHYWKSTTYDGGYIRTLEGNMEFVPGDWIIRGVAGEFYPCKPDIFTATYEPATPAPSSADRDTMRQVIQEAFEGDSEGFLQECLDGVYTVTRTPQHSADRDAARLERAIRDALARLDYLLGHTADLPEQRKYAEIAGILRAALDGDVDE